MLILVTYDVSTEKAEGSKRLRNVAKICQNFGQRVQKSVFECQVTKEELYQLREKLLEEFNPKEDSLRFYRITEPSEQNIEEYGCFKSIDFEGPLIV